MEKFVLPEDDQNFVVDLFAVPHPMGETRGTKSGNQRSCSREQVVGLHGGTGQGRLIVSRTTELYLLKKTLRT